MALHDAPTARKDVTATVAAQAELEQEADEVHGYVGVHTTPPNNNPTYAEFFAQLTNHIGGIVGAPFKPV